MSDQTTLGLFEAVGIELEYMIVSADTLDVQPLADKLLAEVGGGFELEVEVGEVAWSNELALHVIEMKTNGPAADLRGLGRRFNESARHMQRLLEPMGARLMPTGMHPWMDPARELRLWPHENDVIYRTFDRIFDCSGHGWANLQSMHINLPFDGDDEFGRLHAAVRAVLPILPALAASSPFAEGARTGTLDTRMEVYRHNADRLPLVGGMVVPEPVFTRAAYMELLDGIYQDLAPVDPDGILRHEWVNARGAIARFEREAIEIRVLDTQECASADIAIAGAVTAAVRCLVEETYASAATLRAWPTKSLADLFLRAIARGGEARIFNDEYLELFGWDGGTPCTMSALWRHIVDRQVAGEPGASEWTEPLRVILDQGCLARRILRATGERGGRERLAEVYRQLCDCLIEDRVFVPA